MSKKQLLLDAAQIRVREGGYSNFSFRELAKEVGIKSASVHYHFPTKEDLGAQLARQYTEVFINELGDPKAFENSQENPVKRYIEHFRSALHRDQKMCLCGVLGSESAVLPELVQREIKRFFEKNLQWLELAITNSAGQKANSDISQTSNKAAQVMSVLEGAMMMSIVLDDYAVFDKAVAGLE